MRRIKTADKGGNNTEKNPRHSVFIIKIMWERIPTDNDTEVN